MTTVHYRLRTLDEVYGMATHLATHFADAPMALNGLFELLMNAIEHGNLEIGFAGKTQLLANGRWAEEIAARQKDPRYINRVVNISLTCTDQWNEVVIADAGAGFDWASALTTMVANDQSHGRGLLIAQGSGFERMTFNAAGNAVTCRSAVG